MDEILVSKKELLELTGISYGQLYRWKRKQLIPEEWFIRRSTFTGQETFFPKEKILARIDRIKDMKEDLSLDELANMFSPNAFEISLTKDELIKHNIVSNNTLDFLNESHKYQEVFTFDEILYVYILDQLLASGDISLDEGKILLHTLELHFKKFKDYNCDLLFIRKLGVSTCLLMSSPSEVYFEEHVKIVAKVQLANEIQGLKLKLT